MEMVCGNLNDSGVNFQYARVVHSLSSACLVLCGAWCSDPGTHVLSYGSCWGLDTRAPCSVLLCERAVSSLLGRALSCPRVLWCARSSCLYWLHAFMLCLV